MKARILTESSVSSFSSNASWRKEVGNYITYEKGYKFSPSDRDTRKPSKTYGYSLKLLDGDWGNFYLNVNTGIAVISCSTHYIDTDFKLSDSSERSILFMLLKRNGWKWRMTVPYFIYADKGSKSESPVENYIPSACSYARKFVRQLSLMPDEKVTPEFIVNKLKQVSKTTSRFQISG